MYIEFNFYFCECKVWRDVLVNYYFLFVLVILEIYIYFVKWLWILFMKVNN